MYIYYIYIYIYIILCQCSQTIPYHVCLRLQKYSLFLNFTPYFHDCKKLLLSFEFYPLFSRAGGKLLFWKNPSEGSDRHVRLFSAPTCASQCKLRRLRANAQLSALLYSRSCACVTVMEWSRLTDQFVHRG